MMHMRIPKFTLNDVKFADDPATFMRANELYRSNRVGTMEEIGNGRGYRAVVRGTQPYEVWISSRRIDEGDCTCYLGQKDVLCKHMLALALAVLDATGGYVKSLPVTDLMEVKKLVSVGMKKLRPYNGPSRVWFAYQRTLATGAGIISEAVSGLPPTLKSADYLWDLVRRISNKLATIGIDDSDGVVGNCIRDIVALLGEFSHDAHHLHQTILSYCDDDTGFGFEDDLRTLLKE